MNATIFSFVAMAISIITTIVIGTIGFFIKRYISQSDQRITDMYSNYKELSQQMSQSFEKFNDAITQLKITIKKIQTENTSNKIYLDEKFKNIEGKLEKHGRSIGSLFDKYHEFKAIKDKTNDNEQDIKDLYEKFYEIKDLLSKKR